nr:acyltransferase [Paraburkholderia aspalathi]
MVSRSAATFYRAELDVIRFLAFFLVFVHHVLPHQAEGFSRHFGSQAAAILAAVANGLGFGLCLFFFLSAYLITELLLREKTRTSGVELKRFYQRRILRIWPLYFLGIGIGIAIALVTRSTADFRQFLAYLGLVGNWYVAAHGWSDNPMTPLWSILIEEQFYLLWPFVIKATGTTGTWVCAALFGILGLTETNRLASAGAQLDYEIWANTLVQFMMFSAGAVTAIALQGSAPALGRVWRCLLAIVGVASWFVAAIGCNAKGIGAAPSGLSIPAGYALAALGCICIFLTFIGTLAKMPWTLVYLGRISFGLYVFHEPAIQIVHGATVALGHPLGYLSMSPLALALTIVVAVISFKYFETPFLRGKAKLAVIDTRPGN